MTNRKTARPRSRFPMTAREKVEGRLAAANVEGGAAAATPISDSVFRVKGRKGDQYTVFAPSTDFIRCDCQAGSMGRPCWHAAAAFLRIVADSTVAA